jgi:hypothetical protein
LLPLPLGPAYLADSYGHTAAAPETVRQLFVKFSIEPICYSATTPKKRRPEDPEVEPAHSVPPGVGKPWEPPQPPKRLQAPTRVSRARAYWSRNCSCRGSHAL